jgi:endoglucanase
MGRLSRWVFLLFLLAWSAGGVLGGQPVQSQDLNYLHTEGNQILDANGSPVILTGISWFGLETENYAPHGLWARSLDSFLDQIVALGFNTIRLPYSNQLLEPGSQPNGINYDLNPDLVGLSGLEIMDRVIAGAGERGLKVILDRHRPDSHAQSELWYTPQYSEERWISDWVMLAERYAGDDTVIGVDLHNEPHGRATWGSDDPATDWRLAAERAGNAILSANPDLLIIVQGVQEYQGDTYWWGGNLMGAREHPGRLDLPGRLVYSPHTYGPGVYPQPWFSDPSFPDNMPEIWDRHWGFLNREGIAPVVLGEFGGRSVKNDQEGIWQRALVAYLQENQISYVYWSLNPNSGDTGGILLDDWQSVDPAKEELLSSYQFPLIGSGEGRAASTPPLPAASATLVKAIESSATPAPTPSAAVQATRPAVEISSASAGLKVLYHTSNQADQSVDSKPEFIIVNTGQAEVQLDELELVYWFQDDPGKTYMLNCDWAHIGCENIRGEFKAGADGFNALHIRFQPGLEPLLLGQDSGEIKLRFNRSDWSEIRQSDDYSFTTGGGYVEWEKVTLYSGGNLVWGSEPGSTSPVSAAPGAATVTAGPPPDALPTVTSPPDRPVPTATATVKEKSSIPNWAKFVITALIAFTLGILIAAVWLLRKVR